MKHTPGPWDASGLTVYDTCLDGVASTHTAADARLIAAAPELADLCEMVARLNPAAGEIGAGMLANMVEKARNIMVQIEGGKENK